jgi:phosphoribosylanthranilate isomerase
MARSCIEAARDRADGHRFYAVGVFVDASPDEIERTVREAGLDAVQLSGSEPPALLREIMAPAIKSLRPGPNAGARDVLSEIASYDNSEKIPIGYQIDGFVEGLAGGTGHRADWNLAAMVNRDRPIILAGGLDPSNVTAAIQTVRPGGVDVSSGVEVDGKKDTGLIGSFIRAARLAFQGLRSEPH